MEEGEEGKGRGKKGLKEVVPPPEWRCPAGKRRTKKRKKY